MSTEDFNSLGTFQAHVMDTLWDLGEGNIHQIRDPVLLTLPCAYVAEYFTTV